MDTKKPKRLVPLGFAAGRLHVPRAWLASECDAGRLPHLRAGDAILLDLPRVERLLLHRAQRTAAVVGGRA